MQRYFRTWENRGFATVRQTLSKIAWYSIIDMLVMIGVAVAQVYVVRYLFDKGSTKRYRVWSSFIGNNILIFKNLQWCIWTPICANIYVYYILTSIVRPIEVTTSHQIKYFCSALRLYRLPLDRFSESQINWSHFGLIYMVIEVKLWVCSTLLARFFALFLYSLAMVWMVG